MHNKFIFSTFILNTYKKRSVLFSLVILKKCCAFLKRFIGVVLISKVLTGMPTRVLHILWRTFYTINEFGKALCTIDGKD